MHEQHLAGRSVLDQPRTPGHLGPSGEDWCNEDESRGGDKKPTLHRSASLPGGYLTRIRWPTVSWVGLIFGFSFSSSSTVVSKRSATSLIVSPARSR